MRKSSERYRKIRLMVRLFKYLKSYRRHFIILFIFTILSAFLGLVPVYLMKPLTDDVFVASNRPINDRIWDLNLICFMLVLVQIVDTVISSLLNYSRSWLSQKIGMNLRRVLYAHLQKLSLQFFYEEKTGDLHNRITDDPESIQRFFVRDIVDFIISFVMLIGITIILFYLEWRLAIILIIPFPLILILLRVFGEKIIVIYRKLYHKLDSMSSLLFNAISGIIVVKTNVAEERELARFDKANTEIATESLRNAFLSFTFLPLIGIIIFSAGVGVRWFGGWRVIQNQLTVGEIIVFMGYTMQFYGPLSGINQIYLNFQDAVTATERIFRILDTEPKIYSAPGAIDLPTIKGNIKFTDVTFSYDGHKKVLEHVNLEVKPGEVIGIAGRSGGGKTTLLKLLCRLYDPLEGFISIDGFNLFNVKLGSLRKQIGIVLQETILFYGTVAENIAYGRPDASKKEIVFAAKAAGAHDFIMRLPYAYDTLMGEEVGLSGGQKQRISIARVLLKNPRIAIFDEALSSVDLETGAFIQASMKMLAKNSTVFIISQKPSELKMANRLIVIDNGRIVESGTYESLSKSGGIFTTFIKKNEINPEDIEKRSLSIHVT